VLYDTGDANKKWKVVSTSTSTVMPPTLTLTLMNMSGTAVRVETCAPLAIVEDCGCGGRTMKTLFFLEPPGNNATNGYETTFSIKEQCFVSTEDRTLFGKMVNLMVDGTLLEETWYINAFSSNTSVTLVGETQPPDFSMVACIEVIEVENPCVDGEQGFVTSMDQFWPSGETRSVRLRVCNVTTTPTIPDPNDTLSLNEVCFMFVESNLYTGYALTNTSGTDVFVPRGTLQATCAEAEGIILEG
jgi:hypothetical protein